MAKNLGISNYQGIATGNPWNQGKAGPGPTRENRRMSTCNRLDLQTLGTQPIMPKNLPDHWSSETKVAQEVLLFRVACSSCGDSIHNSMI